MKVIVYVVLLLVLVKLCVGSGEPVTYYVDVNSSYNGTECGVDQGSACTNILDAINGFIATNATSPLVVSIAVGTYGGLNRFNVYGLDLTLSGAVGTGVIIDGNNTASLFKISETSVVSTNNQTYPTSLTLKNLAVINTFVSGMGGVIYANLQNSSAVSITISNCQFNNNNLEMSSSSASMASSNSLDSDDTDSDDDSDDDNDNGSGSIIYFKTGYRYNSTSSIYIQSSQFNSSFTVYSMFYISSSYGTTTFSAQDSTFTNNKGQFATVIYSTATMSLLNSTFSNNYARMEGGVLILNNRGFNSISGCTFSRNQAGNGGALSVDHSFISISESNFQFNSARVYGGAIYATGDTSYLYINTTTFSDSLAASGGAISLENGKFQFSICTFTYNNATNGGSLYLYQVINGSMSNSFITNSLATDGGGIYTTSSVVSLSTTQISNNSAASGGSIYCSNSKLTLFDTMFNNNVDTGDVSSQNGGEIVPNESNIFCSLLPSYTFCSINGDDEYSGYCGEQNIKEKSQLSKGAIAGIVIGSFVGAAIIVFGLAFLITKKFSINTHFFLREEKRSLNTDHD